MTLPRVRLRCTVIRGSREAIRVLAFTATLLAVVTSYGAAAAAPKGPWPPALLSQTGLFSGTPQTPAGGVRRYSPQYPLWSDGATKRRWIRLPHGAVIDATDAEAWVFPPGTRFWKEFSWAGKKVETRYLEKIGPARWLYATYAWNDAQTDATLVPAEGHKRHVEIAPGVFHDLPSHEDCRACHEGENRDAVLGFDALQLSPDRDPNAPHAEEVESGWLNLAKLMAERRLKGAPTAWLAHPPRAVAGSPTARAALGYLHGNCWGCHNEKDPVSSVGMSLRVSLVATSEAEQPAVRTALGKRSKYQIPGVAPGESRRIAPGNPAASALFFRMRSRHPLRQMPPLGTRIVDQEALALLTRWVAGH
jgi:hypothetical protein